MTPLLSNLTFGGKASAFSGLLADGGTARQLAAGSEDWVDPQQ